MPLLLGVVQLTVCLVVAHAGCRTEEVGRALQIGLFRYLVARTGRYSVLDELVCFFLLFITSILYRFEL